MLAPLVLRLHDNQPFLQLSEGHLLQESLGGGLNVRDSRLTTHSFSFCNCATSRLSTVEDLRCLTRSTLQSSDLTNELFLASETCAGVLLTAASALATATAGNCIHATLHLVVIFPFLLCQVNLLLSASLPFEAGTG